MIKKVCKQHSSSEGEFYCPSSKSFHCCQCSQGGGSAAMHSKEKLDSMINKLVKDTYDKLKQKREKITRIKDLIEEIYNPWKSLDSIKEIQGLIKKLEKAIGQYIIKQMEDIESYSSSIRTQYNLADIKKKIAALREKCSFYEAKIPKESGTTCAKLGDLAETWNTLLKMNPEIEKLLGDECPENDQAQIEALESHKRKQHSLVEVSLQQLKDDLEAAIGGISKNTEQNNISVMRRSIINAPQRIVHKPSTSERNDSGSQNHICCMCGTELVLPHVRFGCGAEICPSCSEQSIIRGIIVTSWDQFENYPLKCPYCGLSEEMTIYKKGCGCIIK